MGKKNDAWGGVSNQMTMALFKLIPSRRPTTPIEFESWTVAGALAIATRHNVLHADLWQEGDYLCTLHRSDGESDFWQVGNVRSSIDRHN